MTQGITMTDTDRGSVQWLALGAIIGLGLGFMTALGWLGNEPLSPSVAAKVNDTNIRQVEYQRALKLYSSEKRDPLTEEDRSLVLRRLVEEELLVQQAMKLDLFRIDRGVRTVVLQSVLSGVMAESEAADLGIEGAGNEASQDDVLSSYLGQLRNTASIRWTSRSQFND